MQIRSCHKTTLWSTFDTIYFNQIYKVFDIVLVVLVRRYPFRIRIHPYFAVKLVHHNANNTLGRALSVACSYSQL